MKKILILIFFLGFCDFTFAHVCQNIKEIKGFEYSKLFNNSILNAKSIDYYSFESECDTSCVLKKLKAKNVVYNIYENNISIFNKSSIGTITIDSKRGHNISGYLTCSSNAKRTYISIPTTINTRKVTLDLQTMDGRNISRIINMQNYTKKDYLLLTKDLSSKATIKKKVVGFANYNINYNRKNYVVKVSNLNRSGDFILIIEQFK